MKTYGADKLVLWLGLWQIIQRLKLNSAIAMDERLSLSEQIMVLHFELASPLKPEMAIIKQKLKKQSLRKVNDILFC